MTFELLETPRLQLRMLTPEVYDHVFARYTQEEVMIFFGHSSEEQYNNERWRYQNGLRTFNKSFLMFHLIDKETGKVIGWCGFHTWYLDHDRAEIGYILADDAYKGRGLMSEALPPIVDYGFRTMQLHRIEAFVGPNNEPSLKLLKRMHFTQEGYLREHYKVNGKLEDSVLFPLLKSEYEERES